MSITKARAWLLGRPEPARPLRRIVSISVFIVTAGFLSAVVGLPPSFRVAASRVLWFLILALLVGGIILLARVWHRGRKARRARG